MSRIDNYPSVIWISPKHSTCPSGKLRTTITSPKAKSTSPGLLTRRSLHVVLGALDFKGSEHWAPFSFLWAQPYHICPWGQCPIKKWEANSFYVKRDKTVDVTPRRLFMSHSPFNGANFCGEETGHSKSPGKQIWKLIWNKQKITVWSYWPYIYDEWLSKYSIQWCCFPVWELQKQCPLTVPSGKDLTCCNSLPTREESFLTRKEYAICRLPCQIQTYSLG